jgi:uncharacterized protein
MPLSNYIKTYPLEDRPGSLLVCSTKKTSVAVLKKEIIESAETGGLSSESLKPLSDLGFVVPDRDAERRSMLEFIDGLNSRDTGMNVTVVLNMDCNFACGYCYEGDMKDRLYMTEDTADRLIGFIKEKFTSEKNSIDIDFFGGEPLLSRDLIKYISRAVKSFAAERGAQYIFSLVTNGSLLKRPVAEELKVLGLQTVKITLDGPAEIHDKCRPFKGGGGSFDAITRNIKDTCDIVKIGIGGNFGRENYRAFPALLDYLEREGLTPEKISQVKFDPVMNRRAGDTSPADFVDGCMSINEPWLIEAGLYLREEILKRGYFTPKMMPMPCQVELKNSYVVHFDGTLYKCPGFIGKKNFQMGSLREGMTDYSSSYGTGIWQDEECLGCEYLPLCFGGCKYMTYIREGKVERKDCKRPYLDASLETLIKQDIKYRRRAKAK